MRLYDRAVNGDKCEVYIDSLIYDCIMNYTVV